MDTDYDNEYSRDEFEMDDRDALDAINSLDNHQSSLSNIMKSKPMKRQTSLFNQQHPKVLSSSIESSQFVMPSSPLAKKSASFINQSLQHKPIDNQILNTSDVVSEDEYIFDYPEVEKDTYPCNSEGNIPNSYKESISLTNPITDSDNEVLNFDNDSDDEQNKSRIIEYQKNRLLLNNYVISSDSSMVDQSKKIDCQRESVINDDGITRDVTALQFNHDVAKAALNSEGIHSRNNDGVVVNELEEPLKFSYKPAPYKIHKHSAAVMSPLIAKRSESILPLKRTAQVMQQIAKKNTMNQTRHVASIPSKSFVKRPSTGLYKTAVTNIGTPLYFPFTTAPARSLNKFTKSTKLLEIDIHTAIHNVKQDALFKASQQKASSLSNKDSKVKKEVKKVQETQLWVDKYSPKRYTDLVGEESLNREIFDWIKQWDYCVFKKHKLAKEVFAPKKFTKNWKESTIPEQPEDAFIEEKDSLKRPDKKIMMLSGRAGRGKTTLAHVLSQLAGYDVIEINASDERTGDSLKNKLMGAINCRGLLSSKPNIIVIDEIDGASMTGSGESNFMKVLTDLIADDAQKSNTISNLNLQPAFKQKSKKNSKAKKLQTPIICICNDEFASVLRPLKPICQVFKFVAPSTKQLAKRLLSICKIENLNIDMKTLLQVCEVSDGDIRSCLHALQFVSKDLGVGEFCGIEKFNGVLGSKDMHLGVLSILEKLFVVQRAGDKLKKNNDDEGDSRYIARLLPTISDCGEFSKLLQGCTGNYLNTKFVDYTDRDGKGKLEDISNWICFHDQLDTFVNNRMQFEMMAYMPFTYMNFYRLFASAKPIKCEYPKQDYEVNICVLSTNLKAFVDLKANNLVLDSIWDGMELDFKKSWGSKRHFLVECMPYLLRIIVPDIKGNNVQLLRGPERKKTDMIVDTMIQSGLKYITKMEELGQLVYKLDPPADSLLLKSNVDSNQIPTGNNFARQMIMTEVTRGNLKRYEDKLREKAGLPKDYTRKPKSAKNYKENSKPKAEPEFEREVTRDFFGKIIESTEVPTESIDKIVFKFREGFSNAVRKPLAIRDLL